ncbi:MAG: ThuA domain-containing protein [Thermoguttaceae bacterium]|jgi:type 1 glutamine amidotransferase
MPLRLLTAILLSIGLAATVRAEPPKPLKVLWCTGGGSHDYKGLTPLLTKSIRKYARAEFDVSWDYKSWAKKGFADQYDAVVQFHTIHDKDLKIGKAIADNIAATIRDGKPMLVIHGTLHSFRELGAGRNAYCEAIGLTSSAHDKATELATRKVADHPITRFWPDDWKTPNDELYQNIKFWPGATPLLTAYSGTSKKDHVVAWINQYGKGRVFATSLGHGTPTTDLETYHRLLANGLLWITNKLDASGRPKPGYAGTATAQ